MSTTPARSKTSARRGSHFGLFSPERASHGAYLLEANVDDPDAADMSRPAKLAEQWASISADAAASGDVEGAKLAAVRAQAALEAMKKLADAAGGADVDAGSNARSA